AVHKPKGITSASVLRDLQTHFNPSTLFAPWLSQERYNRSQEPQHARRRRRHANRLEVKIGHGGTLDPLATGILVAGVGRGTKHLNSFLGCTKTYEAVFLFGAETDTYDCLGKVVKKAPYEHITREKVEDALAAFRGSIMQRPPIFSALRVNGKKLYEYAREGKEPPVEIKSRPVEVLDLGVVEWFEPGTHEWEWPVEEVVGEEKVVAERLLEREEREGKGGAAAGGEGVEEGRKRKDAPGEEDGEAAKKVKGVDGEAVVAEEKVEVAAEKMEEGAEKKDEVAENKTEEADQGKEAEKKPQPPAVKITMTVSSGFYVRSLAHDLGRALGSCGLMSELVRSRQADFVLEPEKVLEYKDLEAGEEVWGPKVQGFLEDWERKRL
ncbi:pseudouridine synthase, partial [Aspergillus ellipticus CBS 707.79]